MKYRNGFVSNSSSSSFIIIMPEGQDLNFGTLGKLLFGNRDPSTVTITAHSNYVINGLDALVEVLTDAEKEGKCSPKDLLREVEDSGGVRGAHSEASKAISAAVVAAPSWQSGVSYAAYQNSVDQWLDEYAPSLEHVTAYRVVYSDESLHGAAMEHGDLFDYAIYNGSVIRISHH